MLLKQRTLASKTQLAATHPCTCSQRVALAGLTVALVMVPQAVAYAQLAGMPLVTGFVRLLVAGVAGGAVWQCQPLVCGACRADLCVDFSLIERFGRTWLSRMGVVGSLVGLAYQVPCNWLWALGGYGWLLNLISAPVLMGFTQAAALLIMASQVPALLGMSHLQ